MSSLITSLQNLEESPNEKLKNYLTPIVTYADLLSQEKFGKLSDSQKEKIELIKEQTKKITNYLETIKNEGVSQLESVNMNDQTQELKLNILGSELKERVTQATLLQKKRDSDSIRVEKRNLEYDISAISKEITKVQKDLIRNRKRIMLFFPLAIFVPLFLTFDIPNLDLFEDQVTLGQLKSKYLIENLRGDTIDTWLSWRLTDGDVLYVNIVNAHKYPEKAEMIKDVILSKETFEIDDSLTHKRPKGFTSTYYLGWAGALGKASEDPTKFFIPANLEVTDSSSGAGDITIRLAKERSGDGFSGWTKSIADEKQNQILKSDITIYDVDNLSKNQLITITRHELGHAFGLAHSSAPEDLMYPEITTAIPYISPCDIDAIVSLYDGGKSSQVVCEI